MFLERSVGVARLSEGSMAHTRLKIPAVREVPGQDCTNFFEWGESLGTACLRRLAQEWPLGRVA